MSQIWRENQLCGIYRNLRDCYETCAVQSTTRTGYMMTSPKFSTWRQNQGTRIRVAFQLFVQRLEMTFSRVICFRLFPQYLRSCAMEGNTGQEWNWINLYQIAWRIISYLVVTYRAKQQTSRWTDMPYAIHRVIVWDMPLHRTVCCYIVPAADDCNLYTCQPFYIYRRDIFYLKSANFVGVR